MKTAGEFAEGSNLLVCLSGRGDKDLDQYWKIKGLTQ